MIATSYRLELGVWSIEAMGGELYRLKRLGLQVDVDREELQGLFRLLEAAVVLEGGHQALHNEA